jgi:hypothetical protein
MAAVVGVVVKYNFLSRILLIASSALDPESFGPLGGSAGWLEAWNLCKAADKGQLPLLFPSDLARLADTLLFRLTQQKAGAVAQTPNTPSICVRPNATYLQPAILRFGIYLVRR